MSSAPGRLICTVALLALASGACTPLDDAMAAIFGRSMRDQPSFDPYEMTVLPPEGTVPLSAGNYPAGHFDVNVGQPEGSADVPPPFTEDDMANRPEVVDSLTQPGAPDAGVSREGRAVVRACVHRLPRTGRGRYHRIHHRAVPDMATYPLTGEAAMGRSDGYIYGMIRIGRVLMPAYGHQISHYDRWHVVNYVRQLQGMGAGAEEAGN